MKRRTPPRTPAHDEAGRCDGCGTRTTPCTGRPGCRHVGRWEWYMVTDEVWGEANAHPKAILCIGCLERALGRELRPADFRADLPINAASAWDTPRLASRKGQTPAWTPSRRDWRELERV